MTARMWGAGIAVLGVIAALGGVIAGLVPVQAVDGGTCGSVFTPRHGAGGSVDAHLLAGWCADDLASRGTLTWTLVVAGVVALVVGVVLLARRERPRKAAVPVEQPQDQAA